MRTRAVYRLATVLTKSQLRGNQRGRIFTRWLSKPCTILVVDVSLICVLGCLGYAAFSSYLPSDFTSALQGTEIQGLTAIPTATSFAVILLGILGELSQSIQSSNTDLVNWLPISPSEYVAGSTLSLAYTYSFLPSLFLGASLGPAIFFGQPNVWLASAIMSTVSLLIGACVVEMLRSITNRISSSFYKRSGRSGIIVRLCLTILVLVFFQLLFSGQIIVYVLHAIVQTVEAVWFIPVVWPSLAVQTASEGLFLPLLFALLSLAFTSVLFGLAVNFRTRYWIPVPVSIKINSKPYQPTSTKIGIPGITSAESAIFRKDLRSLTRRREMARFLAIPFVLAASMAISLSQISTASGSANLAATIPLYLIPIAVFCEVLSMTSIGQEGQAVWNIYAAPIEPKQLLKAKMLLTTLLGIAFTFAMLIAITFFVSPTASDIALLLCLGFIVVLEEASFGLYVATKFPDFRETVRSRYVTIWGSMIGMFLGIVIALVTATPILLEAFFSGLTIELTAATFLVGLIICLVSWKVTMRQAKLMFENIQI